MALDPTEYLIDRMARMRDLIWLAEGELHSAIFRARRMGIPLAEIVRVSERDEGLIERIIDEFNPDDLPGPDEPEPNWLYARGGAIFTR
jgi:hypothetical protein